MAGTCDGPRSGPAIPRSTWGERAVVLGGFAVAAIQTAVAAVLGGSMETVAAVWMVAVAWTVPCSLALALRRGIRRGDWSAFRSYELPDGRDERIDWASKTGRYAYLREWEDRILRNNSHLR